MENLKVFYITYDNWKYYDDPIIGDSSKRQVAVATKQFIDEDNDNEWLKTRVVELPLEGIIHKGHINIITTIKLNTSPCRVIANNFYHLVEIIESYMELENDWRKFMLSTDYIKL